MDKPFLISTSRDLLQLSCTAGDHDKNFKLTEDIYLSDTYTQSLIGHNTFVFEPVHYMVYHRKADPVRFEGTPFSGSFDGGGYGIYGFVLDSDASVAGLFGKIAPKGIVKNLNLIGAKIAGKGFTGGFVGSNYGNIDNCSADVELRLKS